MFYSERKKVQYYISQLRESKSFQDNSCQLSMYLNCSVVWACEWAVSVFYTTARKNTCLILSYVKYIKHVLPTLWKVHYFLIIFMMIQYINNYSYTIMINKLSSLFWWSFLRYLWKVKCTQVLYRVNNKI